MNFPLFIAKRLYGSRTDKSVSRPAIGIATFGIAIGMAIMIVSVAIVLGFKGEIKRKLIGFGSDIQIVNLEHSRSYESWPIAITDSLENLILSHPMVAHVQHFVSISAIFKTDDQFRGVSIKGIGEEYDLSFLRGYLVEGEIPLFSDSVSGNKVVISRAIAREMQLHVSDKIYCYFVGENVRARHFEIAGIYETHLSEFDNNLVFADCHTIRKINGWQQDQNSGVEIGLKDYSALNDVFLHLSGLLDTRQDHYGQTYYVTTIEMMYPSLFAWLDLLDMNVWVIMILMLAVSGFTMISGLLIIILERTNMIGILKALGAQNGMIRQIFLNFSVMLVGRGMLWGNLFGLFLCWVQNQTGIIHLDPETYYVDVVPIEINWYFVILLNVCSLLVSLLVLVGPSYLVAHIHPTKSIRFE